MSPVCQLPNCNTPEHCGQLDLLWRNFVGLVKSCGESVFGVAHHREYVVPGWNEFVRDFYQISRQSFLGWRQAGSPRAGPIAEHMRQTRAQFKLALRNCKRADC